MLESDALLAHAVCQPVMLVEANTGRERKVGANAHKHSSPVPIVDVKVVLNDPALRKLKVPSVRDRVADGRHDACGFSCLENDHDLIGFGPFEIWVDEFVAATLRCLHDRDVALRRPLLDPALKLLGDVAQGVARHRVQLTIRTEEADNSFGLLERLNQAIQQDAIETAIMPTDAILVVLVERVHEPPPAWNTGGILAVYLGLRLLLPMIVLCILPMLRPRDIKGEALG